MRSYLTAAAAMAMVMLLGSCGNNNPTTVINPPPQTSDQAEVAAVLSSAATLTDDALAQDPSRIPADTLAAGRVKRFAAQAGIRPFTWWQNVTAATPTFAFAFSDTDSTGHPHNCVATSTKQLTGTLVIVPASAADSTRPDSTASISKPLDETITRRIMLSRINIGGQMQWKIVQVSGARVTTPNATTQIMSVAIHSNGGTDTTLINPLLLTPLRRTMQFNPGDSVTVTVATSHPTDAVFLNRSDFQRRLRNNHDGTFSTTFLAGSANGWRWFGVQAMSSGTLEDDTAPVDMQAWHLPFRITGGQPPVDFFP